MILITHASPPRRLITRQNRLVSRHRPRQPSARTTFSPAGREIRFVTNSRTLFEHSLHDNFTHSTSSRSAVHLNPPFFPLRNTVLLERALASLSPALSIITKKCKTNPIPKTGHLSSGQPKPDPLCAKLKHQAPQRSVT